MIDRLSDAGWFKSTYSGAEKACLEVAFLADGAVGVRDSKNPGGPALVVSSAAWDSFLSSLPRH